MLFDNKNQGLANNNCERKQTHWRETESICYLLSSCSSLSESDKAWTAYEINKQTNKSVSLKILTHCNLKKLAIDISSLKSSILYRILQLLQGSRLDSFPLKTLKLGWVAFHSLTFQLKCLDLFRFPILSK